MSRGIGRNFFDTLLETKLEHPRHVSAIVRKRTEPVAIQLSIIYERTGDLSVDSRNFERGKRSAGNSPRAFAKECLRLPRAARKANLFFQRRKSNPFFETTDHSENEQKLASFLFSLLNLYFNKSVRSPSNSFLRFHGDSRQTKLSKARKIYKTQRSVTDA